MRALVDGGVFINNPGISAYAEAKRIFGDEDIFVASLGTGELTRPISYDEAKDWGLASWMLPVMSCMFDGVSDAVDYQLEKILGEQYVRIQTTLSTSSDDMDNATKGNIENLKEEARKIIKVHEENLEKICQQIEQN